MQVRRLTESTRRGFVMRRKGLRLLATLAFLLSIDHGVVRMEDTDAAKSLT